MKISIFVLTAMLMGCATQSVPQRTQLEIRQFQTRSYETNDVKMVMKAMLNVLQDDGYIVKNAHSDLGLLSATKEVDIEDRGQAFLATFLAGSNARWKKNSIIEVTANVSDFGNQCKVRTNFQMKTLDNRGGTLDVQQIEDESFYREFFAKVDKGIFIQKEKL